MGSIEDVEPRIIVTSDKLLDEHNNYWGENPPDVTDMPVIAVKTMQYWLKQKRKSRLKPHSLNPGVCAAWLNAAYDFAISKNKVPVRFKDKDGIMVDLVPEFTTTVWVCALKSLRPSRGHIRR